MPSGDGLALIRGDSLIVVGTVCVAVTEGRGVEPDVGVRFLFSLLISA